MKEWEASEIDIEKKRLGCKNKIVLINIGWAKYFGREEYLRYPYLSEKFIDFLVSQKQKIIVVDTVDIDHSNDLTRPIHGKLLKENILILENLTNFEQLQNNVFRFYCVPAKFEGEISFLVRAFAEIVDYKYFSVQSMMQHRI